MRASGLKRAQHRSHELADSTIYSGVTLTFRSFLFFSCDSGKKPAAEATPTGIASLGVSGAGPIPSPSSRADSYGLGKGRLIIAGSINSGERIRAIAAAGADAFTIGTGVLDGSYSPTKGSLRSQIASVLADCNTP